MTNPCKVSSPRRLREKKYLPLFPNEELPDIQPVEVSATSLK